MNIVCKHVQPRSLTTENTSEHRYKRKMSQIDRRIEGLYKKVEHVCDTEACIYSQPKCLYVMNELRNMKYLKKELKKNYKHKQKLEELLE